MNKLILSACAILLSGCVYEQKPAPINDVSIIEEKPVQIQQPTSMSYPLPSAPQINNVVINEPQPIPDPVPVPEVPNEEIVIDSTPITNDSSKGTTLPVNQATVSNPSGESLNDVVDSIIDTPTHTPNNQPPMGTFNNPVRFDQSKVYK